MSKIPGLTKDKLMQDSFSVKDKVVVITGGAGVLCGTMAKELAKQGAKVAVADYDDMRAHKVCKEIEADGGLAIPVKIDVLDRNLVEDAFGCVLETLGQVDVLINGAGGNKKEATCASPTTFFDLPDEAIRMVFDLNCIFNTISEKKIAFYSVRLYLLMTFFKILIFITFAIWR